MKKILSWDVDQGIKNFLGKNVEDVRIFCAVFFFNMMVFGQKIFSQILSTDDYSRFYTGGVEQASSSGRWMAGLINQHVFTGSMHILPYLNGILGIFSFTMAGYLTAKILKRTRAFETVMVTLLISVTPMVAHNMYFNTNISTWLAVLVGVAGVLLFLKPKAFSKFCGFFMLVISIGCYQTIVQVVIAIAMIKMLMDVLESSSVDDLKKAAACAIKLVLFTCFAFFVSHVVNFLYMDFNGFEAVDRLKKTSEEAGLLVYLKRIPSLFHDKFALIYFKDLLIGFYKIFGLLTFLSVISVKMKKSPEKRNVLIISALLIFFIFLCAPIIINLPYLSGNGMPARAHYAIGWFLAGSFTLLSITAKGVFKTLSNLLGFIIIIVSVCYINVFFDGASRQTKADIIRANQIVERVRRHPNYTSEPLKLKVVGTKDFSVTGWDWNQQAFNTDWSKYEILEHFTDLAFEKMSQDSYVQIAGSLIKAGVGIDAYPAKTSIFVEGDHAIVFLNPNQVNNHLVVRDILKKPPIIQDVFNIYVDGSRLVYHKAPCQKSDVEHMFYLQIFPKDPSVINGIEDFIALDFQISSEIQNNECLMVKNLPSFDIKQINTGQFSKTFDPVKKIPFTFHWQSQINFGPAGE